MNRTLQASKRPFCDSPRETLPLSQRWSNPDRKSTRLNSSHLVISYAVFCLKKKTHQLRLGRSSRASGRAGGSRDRPHLRGGVGGRAVSSPRLSADSKPCPLCLRCLHSDSDG